MPASALPLSHVDLGHVCPLPVSGTAEPAGGILNDQPGFRRYPPEFPYPALAGGREHVGAVPPAPHRLLLAWHPGSYRISASPQRRPTGTPPA